MDRSKDVEYFSEFSRCGIPTHNNHGSMKWAIDATHTAHTNAQTGIQQVCRELVQILKDLNGTEPVVFDRFANRWRGLDSDETATLGTNLTISPSRRRGASWSFAQKFRGWRNRANSDPSILPKGFGGILIPEIPDASRDNPICSLTCHKVGFFHDAVPLLRPDWTPASVVRRFPRYIQTLASLDLVLCISKQSEEDLRDVIKKARLKCPELAVLRLGMPRKLLEAARSSKPPLQSSKCPKILSVGSIEARKNHLAMLDAAQSLWESGLDFELHLVGMLSRQTGMPAKHRIFQLQGKGYPLKWQPDASQEDVIEAYRSADLFLYPSLYEGFGIPILEAKGFGLPIICSTGGALGEHFSEGGCLQTGTSSSQIAATVRSLLENREARKVMGNFNRSQTVRSMTDVASELHELLLQRFPD